MLVIGSQAILASFDEDDLPSAATASMEADIAFFDDPDESKADAVDGAIGELSAFHQTHGYYAQGVSADLAVLPAGWRQRVVLWANQSTGQARAAFLDPHDLVISKLAAGREKDLRFAHALVDAHLVDVAVLLERVAMLSEDTDRRVIERLHRLLGGWLS